MAVVAPDKSLGVETTTFSAMSTATDADAGAA